MSPLESERISIQSFYSIFLIRNDHTFMFGHWRSRIEINNKKKKTSIIIYLKHIENRKKKKTISCYRLSFLLLDSISSWLILFSFLSYFIFFYNKEKQKKTVLVIFVWFLHQFIGHYYYNYVDIFYSLYSKSKKKTKSG